MGKRIAKVWRLDDFKKEHNIETINCVWDDGVNKFYFCFHPNGFSGTIDFWSMPSACSELQQKKLNTKQVFIAILRINQSEFMGYWGNLQDFKYIHLKYGVYSNVIGFSEKDYLSLVYNDPAGDSRYNNRKWGVIDIHGNEVIPVTLDSIKGWDDNGKDEITLVNHCIGRTLYRENIMNSKYCFIRPNNKGILGTCSFGDFLWLYDINPDIQVWHLLQKSRDILVVGKQFTIYVGKSLNYSFPNNKERLLWNTQILIENGPKYYLFENINGPIAVIDSDNIIKPDNSRSDLERQQIINYYLPRVTITESYLTSNHNPSGKNNSDGDTNGWDYDALLYDALEGDPDAYWNID